MRSLLIFLIRPIGLLFLLCLFFSCASKKNIVYYQDIDSLGKNEILPSYQVKIQPDDLLMIIVSADDAEAAKPFNLKTTSTLNNNKQDAVRGQEVLQLYLVDYNGNIEFPTLGKIKVGNLTRIEVIELLENKIRFYIKNPIISVRITNFKISVQGEVNLPGTYNIASERVTIIEALSMAKDLTIYGRRNNILIIRENNGVKSYNRVDVTKSDFVNSPFYYLNQNDVVYVEPNKTKVNSSIVGPNTSAIMSTVSILVSISALISKFLL